MRWQQSGPTKVPDVPVSGAQNTPIRSENSSVCGSFQFSIKEKYMYDCTTRLTEGTGRLMILHLLGSLTFV